MSDKYLCVTYANDLPIYRELREAKSGYTPNLYIPLILLIDLSKRGARRRRSAWCSASLSLFFRRTFFFFITEKWSQGEVARAYETTEPRGIARVVAKFFWSLERSFATPCEIDYSDVGTAVEFKV